MLHQSFFFHGRFGYKPHCHLPLSTNSLKFHVTFKVRLLSYKCLHKLAYTSVIRFTSTPLLAWRTHSTIPFATRLIGQHCMRGENLNLQSLEHFCFQTKQTLMLAKLFKVLFMYYYAFLNGWVELSYDHTPYSQTVISTIYLKIGKRN